MLRTMGRRQGKGEVERGEEEFIQFLPTVNKRSYPLSHLPSIIFFFLDLDMAIQRHKLCDMLRTVLWRNWE